MGSSNILEISTALVTLCKLLTSDMIPAILPEVTRLLEHENELVRKKAVGALHRCHQIDPTSILHVLNNIRRILCDRDPTVMGATLPLFYDLIE